MQEPGRNRLDITSLSVGEWPSELTESARFPREQRQCAVDSHSVCGLHRPCCVYVCGRGVTAVNADAAAGQRNQAKQSLGEKSLGNKGLSVQKSRVQYSSPILNQLD